MTKHIELLPQQITDNPFKLIGLDWMLITAGKLESYNTMTASWGGLGVLWNKDVCFCFVRPQRYTYEFLEKSKHFTLSFFDEEYRSVLDFCGNNSGRDADKSAATGIRPVKDENGVVYFKEARLVIVCKKIYFQDLTAENFLDHNIEKHYAKKDYHRMYVGEVIKCLAVDE